MKKIDPALITFDTTEDQFLITQKEAEMLSSGELTFHNGMLYRTENFFPQEVPILDLTPEDGFLLNLYGSDKQRPKLQELTIGNKDFVSESSHPNFNQLTQTQIEQCKQFPQFPEIKGIHLKSSKLSIETQEAVKSLIAVIENDNTEHPYVWVERANVLAVYAGEEAKPLLLEILNSTIPLKEGMKLEGFSAKEFYEKYLHSQPSLLEEWTANHQPTLNKIRAGTNENLSSLNPTDEDLIPRPIDMDNLVVEDPTYLSLELEGMENSHIKELELILRGLHHNTGNDRVASFEQFAQHAGTLYGEYRSHVRMLDQDDFDPELTKWTIAIHLQDTYWESFRGRTITILKLFNKLYNPDDKLYYLETPITGMKKR